MQWQVADCTEFRVKAYRLQFQRSQPSNLATLFPAAIGVFLPRNLAGTSGAKPRTMEKVLLALTLALMAGTFVFTTGCTTEQRSGRSTGEYLDDKTLNSKVRAALTDSAEYKFPDVKVESFRGTVQLSGFVANAAQKARAAEIAKSVRGVQTVDNKISVR